MTTPMTELAKYSTTIISTSETESIGDFITRINGELPSGVASETIVNYVNDAIRPMWKYLTSTGYYAFDTSTSTPIVTLPSSMNVDSIVPNGVMVATSTGAVSSTTIFDIYEFAGADDQLEGNMYYEALGSIGLYPQSTTIVPGRIRYQIRPLVFASSDHASTAIRFNIDQDAIDYVRTKVMAMVSRTGNAPDTDLANNFEREAVEISRKIKHNIAKKRATQPRTIISYQEGWDC